MIHRTRVFGASFPAFVSWLTLCAVLLIHSACAALSGYRGDGRFIDHGILGAERYELDLGSVDLSRSSKYEYRLTGLPNQTMTIGLETTETANSANKSSDLPSIRLSLETTDRNVVVSEEGPLSAWRRSAVSPDGRFFYYKWGGVRHVPIGPGVTRPEHVGEKLDKGWGTTFVPNQDRSYLLRMEVVEPPNAPPAQARLVVKSQPRVFTP
jgi:hypothetical protein